MRLQPKYALILTIFLAVGTCYHYFGLLVPQSRKQDAANAIGTRYGYGGDFYPIWLTGRALLFHRTDPYTQEMTRNIQVGLYGRTMNPNRPTDQPAEYRAFAYPLYTDLLAAPLLPFRFEVVRIVLTFLLVPITAATVVLWLRALRIPLPRSTLTILIILTLANYPVLEGMYMEQVALLVGAALALSAKMLTSSRLGLCGILLSLASVKPQMVWLVAIFLLFWSFHDWKRRKALALSFLLTSVLLLVACQIALPGWLAGWLHTLARYSAYTLPPLPQLVLGRYLGSVISLLMLVLAGAVSWKARHQPADSTVFLLSLSFILAATVMLLPSGAAAYDQVVLLPAIFWLWSRRAELLKKKRPIRMLAFAAIIALSWQWIMASGVSLLSLVAPDWARSRAVLVFPIRMAASFPFAVVALMSLFVIRSLRGQTGDFKLPPSTLNTA
jgi:hypothetical protein